PDPRRIERMRTAGTPVATLQMPDATALGAEFFRWEVATATAGLLLGINPFDEPNVQQAKDATRELLNEYVATKTLPTPTPHQTIDLGAGGSVTLTLSAAALGKLATPTPAKFLRLIDRGDYGAILAFVAPG